MGVCGTKESKAKSAQRLLARQITPSLRTISGLNRQKRLEVPKLALTTSQMYKRRKEKSKVSPALPVVTQSTE